MTEKSREELAVELLSAYRYWIGLGVFGLLGLVVLLVFGVVEASVPTVTITRPYKVVAVAMISAAVLGYAPASKALDWLYNPPRRYLVQPGYTADDAGIYELTPAKFEDLTVLDGELYEWPNTSHPTYGVEWYDRERNVAKATWRGSAPDEQLIEREQDIDEMRGKLETKAKERDILVTRAERIVREVILQNTRTLIKEYNRASLVDVGSLSERIDDALDDATITEDLKEQSDRKTDPAAANNSEQTSQPVQQAATDGGGGKHGE